MKQTMTNEEFIEKFNKTETSRFFKILSPYIG